MHNLQFTCMQTFGCIAVDVPLWSSAHNWSKSDFEILHEKEELEGTSQLNISVSLCRPSRVFKILISTSSACASAKWRDSCNSTARFLCRALDSFLRELQLSCMAGQCWACV